MRNDTDQDAVFNFRATAPPGRETSFKPAYESKQISSVRFLILLCFGLSYGIFMRRDIRSV